MADMVSATTGAGALAELSAFKPNCARHDLSSRVSFTRGMRLSFAAIVRMQDDGINAPDSTRSLSLGISPFSVATRAVIVEFFIFVTNQGQEAVTQYRPVRAGFRSRAGTAEAAS
jgi:hypothetical protein